MKTILATLLGSTLIGVSLLAADAPTAPRKAPDFTFSLPGKGPQQLSQYRGKVVALEFIFTTCPHCQAASKVMTKFQQEFAARGLQVLSVAINANADLLVENFVKDYKVGYPVGFASQDDMTNFMGFEKGRFVVPQLALIDRKGMIRYQTPATENDDWDKLMKDETIRAHIEELLGSGTTATSSASRKKTGNGIAVATR
jgi:peroxiredoxin